MIEQIEREISQSQENLVLTNGLEFNYYDTLNRIKLYLNDQYVYNEGKDDAIFWNLSTPRIPHFVKNIDFDTKNLEPYAEKKTSFFQVWILKQKLYKWITDNGFAIKINDLLDTIASYGSAIWKVVYKDGVKELQEVDLEKVYFDQTARELKDSPFFIEEHFLTQYDLKVKKDVWKNVDTLIDSGIKVNSEGNVEDDGTYYKVYERWGEVEEGDKISYKHIILGRAEENEVILFEEEVKKKDFPYYDFHIGKYRGRWLRKGIVERLFRLQVRANKLCNENAQASEIASLLLLKSREAGVAGHNVLEEAESGQILQSEDLQQVGIDNRAFANFIQEMLMIEKQADRLCMTPEIITGEDLPTGITFRGQAALTNAAKNAFKNLRDNVATKVTYIFLREIFPSLVKKWNKEEVVDILEDEEDIYIYNQLKKVKKYNEKAFELMSMGITQIDPEILTQLVEMEMNEDQEVKRVFVGKDYFDFDFGIRMNITGEGVDKAQRNDAYNNILQWIQANPEIQNNYYFRKYAEFNGISTRKMPAQQQPAKPVNTQPIGQPKDKLSALIDTQ